MISVKEYFETLIFFNKAFGKHSSEVDKFLDAHLNNKYN